jgi:hypothetical protein
MLTWTTPDCVRIASELPVNDWSFPLTPESGAAAFTWAQAASGAACAASKEMNTTGNNGSFIKISFQIRHGAPESSRIWHSLMKWRERHELFPVFKKNMSSIMECKGYYTLKPGIQNLHIPIVLFTSGVLFGKPNRACPPQTK